MDNPWDNGWSDTPTGSVTGTTTKPVWLPEETEEDIVAPSWSATTNEVKWNAPDDNPDAVWDTSSTWNPTEDTDVSLGLEPPSPVQSVHTLEAAPSLPLPSSPIRSPDTFGGFETAAHNSDDDTEDRWSSPSFAPDEQTDDAWGSAWAPEPVSETDDEPSDEWETARQQKAKMDQHVPPELLASILKQCAELWPETSEERVKDKDDYTSDRSSGMSGVPGLEDLASRIASKPPPLLIPPIPFARTHTFKSLSDALRLTRHLPISRNSPMAHLLAAKGSTAWESAVRARSDVKDETILPAGWRLLGEEEKDKDKLGDVEKDAAKKGGLLAFWGRRTAAGAGNATRGASQERSASPLTSPRPSVEPTRSPVSSAPHSRAPSVSFSASPAAVPSVESLTPSTLSTIITAPSDPEDLGASAVSRFFTRFSRVAPKPSLASGESSLSPGMGADDPRGLALSPDDIDVLGHFVPSARDSEEDGREEQEDNKILGERTGTKGFGGTFPNKLPPPPPPSQIARDMQIEENMFYTKAQYGSELNSIFGRSTTPVARSDTPKTATLPPPQSTGLGQGTASVFGAPRISTAPFARTGSSGSTNPKSPGLFQSVTMSSRPSPSDKPLSAFILPPPPFVPPPPSPSPFPPPPTSRTSSSSFALSPPSSRATLPLAKAPSRGHTPKPSIVAPPTASLLSSSFDVDESDDEFSAFSSPRSSQSHRRAESGALSAVYDDPSFSFSVTPKSSSTRPLFASQPANNSKHVQAAPFDDFDFAEYVSSPSASGFGPAPATPAKTPVPPLKLPPAKPAQQTDHDLLGGLSYAPSKSVAPTFNVPSPLPPSSSLLSFSSNSSFGSFNTASPATSSKSQNLQPQRTGGLSAQDLSFFEGL